MRFEGSGGSRVDIETIGAGGVIVSVTQGVRYARPPVTEDDFSSEGRIR